MDNYKDFKKFYFELSNINLDAYKEKQMKRRIETLITRKGLNSFAEYADLLKTDKAEKKEFTDYITINVTDFFRTPEHWYFLEKEVIPAMLLAASAAEKSSDGALKIWSAGCSTGEEPYSLSMLLLKYFASDRFKILATDLDEKVLKKAENGFFDIKSLETISGEYSKFKEKYFEQVSQISLSGKNQFKIKDVVKN